MRGPNGHPGSAGRGVPDRTLVPREFRSTVSILVIDDERTLRESCKTLLEAEGYRLESCSRGEEALQLVKRRRFDIVLTDLNMTDVSGMELLKTTLATSPDTIVVVMTGDPSVANNLEALRAGAWDYLPKPFSATHLQILVGRAAHAVFVARESGERVRELEVMLEPGQEIQPDDIPLGGEPRTVVQADDAASFITEDVMGQSYHVARDRVIASFERRYLTWLVNRAGGNMSKAARLAGVDRTTLYRLMERHRLQRETITVMPR